MLVQIKEDNNWICDQCTRKAKILLLKSNPILDQLDSSINVREAICAEHYMQQIDNRDKFLRRHLKDNPSLLKRMLTHERYKLFSKWYGQIKRFK